MFERGVRGYHLYHSFRKSLEYKTMNHVTHLNVLRITCSSKHSRNTKTQHRCYETQLASLAGLADEMLEVVCSKTEFKRSKSNDDDDDTSTKVEDTKSQDVTMSTDMNLAR